MQQGLPLAFMPNSVVADRIRTLGRTEDVAFSPEQARLAIAGYEKNKILVLQIKIVTENSVMAIRSEECVELRCRDFVNPHGLSWVDESTLAVANRGGDVVVVSVPAISGSGEIVETEPLLRLSEAGDGLIRTPGSVAVARLSGDYFDFLVGNNYRNYVSRHIVHRQNGYKVISGQRLFAHGLKIPDGIAVSEAGDLVAVSNHSGRRVDVFRNDASSAAHSPPVFSLAVPNYPHGLRFAMQDRLLLVADAGAPVVLVFAKDGHSWKSARDPVASLKVMDDETFRRGRTNPEEGGPKGLDILKDGSLLVASCEEMPLAFIDFRPTRDQLVGSETADHREFRSNDQRMLETSIAAMKGQHDQIAAYQAEVAKQKARHDRSLDQRILRFLKGAAAKAIASAEKK